MPFTLPSLGYSYEALEPHFDSQTMQIHHTKHHQTYIDKLNLALANLPEFNSLTIENLLSKYAELPQEVQTPVRNQGGGHANHSLFWSIISPQLDQLPDGELATNIQSTFTSFGDFQSKFTSEAASHFGSGWAWLVVNPEKSLSITTSPNQDSPIMNKQIPILGIDLWEHAYYLKYQNRRTDYISAFWHIVNWKKVGELYIEAMSLPSQDGSKSH